MAKYVDGFVIPIPKKNTAAYLKMARAGCKAWMKFGALDYKECILEDVAPPFVTIPFPKMVKVKPGETVWFSFIVFKSKAHRNAVNKKVMNYFAEKYGNEMTKSMPFDLKRFSMGGFKVMVTS